MNFKDLKNPPKKYRPAPFWSWNERLDIEETRKQVREMEEAGLGGYFMHARGGLQTEYLSDEWFANVEAACDEGKSLGMQSWGYDENGWPSGFGGGKVNGLGEEYQQQYLRCERTDVEMITQNTVGNEVIDGKNYHFYVQYNPFYVNTIDNKVIAEFIRVTHQSYKDTMGEKFTDMAGFFTDEPQVSRNGLPWAEHLRWVFHKTYGIQLNGNLKCLFFDVGDYRRIRYCYWKLIRDLFADAFMRQIGEWCRANGSALTGHMVIEEGFSKHIIANGACMPHYEYMDIPGMDHLGRSLASIQTEMQLTSVANQLGKKQILSETFALCGWNVSFEDLRNIYEHQMVHGVNLLCQHLEGYSLRGLRKRDYPASLFKHQPWWKDYRIFNDMVSRIGMLVAEGEISYDVLVLHTVESGWLRQTDKESKEANEICDKMIAVMKALEAAQIQYHLGDDRIMQRHATVENGRLVIGTQKYSVVVVPPCDCLGDIACNLLEVFKREGGKIIFVDEVPKYLAGFETDRFERIAQGCDIVSTDTLVAAVPDGVKRIRLTGEKAKEKPITALVRGFSDEKMTMYYLHNSHGEKNSVTATVRGGSATLFDPIVGEEKPVSYTKYGDMLSIKCDIEAKGSAILFVYEDEKHPPLTEEKRELSPITEKLLGEWEITEADDNILTLDYCDLYFNGKREAKNFPVSDVQEQALSFGKEVKTETVFKFNVAEAGFSRMRLVVETPEIFDIKVNGRLINKTVIGTHFDNAFKVIDIKDFVRLGANEISLTCSFVQSEQVYEMAKNSLVFESEKNKLYYDMEIEAIYLLGDFGVVSDKPFERLDNRGLRTDGKFSVVGQNKTVRVGELASQGYPFFAGEMTFTKKVELTAEEIENRSFEIKELCSNITALRVNGKDAGKILWHPYSIDLSGLLREGENVFEVTVKGNLRNMLGPFHLKQGECLGVGPGSFFHRSPIWLKGTAGIRSDWVNSYCFVEYGLFF